MHFAFLHFLVEFEVSGPPWAPVVRLDQSFFVIGRDLDEKEVTVWLRDMLQTEVCLPQRATRRNGCVRDRATR